jgi:hypothetical protein
VAVVDCRDVEGRCDRVKIQISERETLAVWTALGQGQNWGGNEDVLLGQGEVWATLKVEERFAKARTVGELSTVPKDFDLSDRAVSTLLSILVGNGQSVATGPYSVMAYARIKAAVTAKG